MKPSARERYEAAKMSRSEFDRLRRGEWVPVLLDAASRPAFLSNLPAAKIVATFGSASLDRANPVADGNPDHGQVGGIDVYRVAEAKDGVAINKDWYAIYQDPNHDDQFYVIGPQQDAEHWINMIPNRLAFAEPASVEASIADAARKEPPSLESAEPGAAPNGGPATPVGDSGVTEGPPSVS